MKMCQAMVQEGHEPLLLVPRINDTLSNNEINLWKHYGITEKFKIYWLSQSKKLKGYDYIIRSVLKARSIKVELIYTRNIISAFFSACLGMPVIYEAHNLPMGKTEPFYFILLMKFKELRAFVVKSAALHELYLQKYKAFLEKKITIVAHDAVDLERFENNITAVEARKRLGFDPTCFTVGYSGHLYAGRGIELILELAKLFPEVQFLILGGYPEDVRYYRSCSEISGQKNVRFLGFVSNADLPLYLFACEVLLMPYQKKVSVGGGGNTAGFMSPLKMFEYMACERCIISSDLPVLREVLNDSNAILCDPDNNKAWEEALLSAIPNNNLRESLRKKARIDVNQFTWKNRVNKVLSSISHS